MSLRLVGTGCAAGWSLMFAALHVFWAVGGRTGLASAAGEVLADTRPPWFVVVGLWGTAVLLLVVAGVAAAVAVSTGRRAGLWSRAAAAVVATVLVVRAVGVEVLLLGDVGDVVEAVGPAERDAGLWVWNPWFLLGGVLFALAASAPGPQRT